jgi:uncharacterized protein DUF3485
MSKRSPCMMAVSLTLIAVTALFIQYRRTHQRLGIPGVKVVATPVYDADGKVAGTNSVFLPEFAANFKSEAEPVQRMVLEWLPADTTYGQRRYKAPNGLELVFQAVLMGADRTSIHKPEYCLVGSGWKIEKTEPDTVTIRSPHPYELPIKKMSITREVKTTSGHTFQQRGHYVFWFVADKELTADHNQRMWWLTRDLMLRGILQRWAYLACLVAYPPGQEEKSYQRIKEFIADAVPQFQLTHGPETRLARAEKP